MDGPDWPGAGGRGLSAADVLQTKQVGEDVFVDYKIIRGDFVNLKTLCRLSISKVLIKIRVKEKKASPTAPPKFSKAARRFYNENIKEHEPQRLAKVLAAAGALYVCLDADSWLFLVASRRTSEELIFQGKVTVNGSVCTAPQTKVDISKDSIYVNGNRISKKLPPKLYFAVNKPKGYICSSGEEKSVISLLDDYLKGWNKLQPGVPKPRLFTVGRLDVATTGLIIVTNDGNFVILARQYLGISSLAIQGLKLAALLSGEFAQKVSHPSSNITKEYVVTIDGAVHKKHLVAISGGTVIDGVKVVPDLVEPLDAQADTKRTRLKIVASYLVNLLTGIDIVKFYFWQVHEGRNHEVRELVQNAGLKVVLRDEYILIKVFFVFCWYIS
ncbi:unnamed protein product [Triticum turgidum subsp. durum]|uniref:RNA-binding S4 domain-containing protein n=1 Tax=Triticum turgidum subsp. durum TaxID=4567 RepID=A0A9R0VW71_TRITD|nr:unnamed protein product [Triticum turgidum subsp. durum]